MENEVNFDVVSKCRTFWAVVRKSFCYWTRQVNSNLGLEDGHSTETEVPLPEGGGGDACWKFWIKHLKETSLGMAQAFFLTPKWDHFKTQRQIKNTVTFNDGKDIIIEYFYP